MTDGSSDADRLDPSDAPDPLLALFGRDRDVHPYGIADVEQLWGLSRWWIDGEAALGVMDLPGSPVPVIYAVSARDPAGTLDLLSRLERTGDLPDRFVITGPIGLTERLTDGHTAGSGTGAHADGTGAHATSSGTGTGAATTRTTGHTAGRTAVWSTQYVKLALRHPDRLPAADPDVHTLGRHHLDALARLYATDPSAGDFFHPGLLDTGYYVGLGDGGQLLATAGIHVLDRANGVAAIGNVATHPQHRGQGLARRVTATLCHRLLAEVSTVGLNVRVGNEAAMRLYERLGFATVTAYEEAELDRR